MALPTPGRVQSIGRASDLPIVKHQRVNDHRHISPHKPMLAGSVVQTSVSFAVAWF